ncbi:MAG: hypothetical protein KIB43_07880 [Clostridium baratii]|uniref:hypothetical protein n=1 Tax=Clostridium baratii TaxID=1561 RepID=UPI00242EF72E|nr:hypothetical protein [Clostridium baratii]MBS6006867.1 hypothetical protein [Clostridium baratii]
MRNDRLEELEEQICLEGIESLSKSELRELLVERFEEDEETLKEEYDSKKELIELYYSLCDEIDDESTLYPNGRDYDSEDFE